MLLHTAAFVKSSVSLNDCPKGKLLEFAFIGRSNVGKSSLINAITRNKKLAKTSSSPGKTQCINHFLINDSFYFVDLPGYGYAKVGKRDRAKWQKFTYNYLKNRTTLSLVNVLIDSRIPPQKLDIEFLNFLGQHELPFYIIFTKADKLKSSVRKIFVENFKKALAVSWEEFPKMIFTSSQSKEGCKELLLEIDNISKKLSSEK